MPTAPYHSEQEWEDQRHVIARLYIDEGWSQLAIADHLTHEGFSVKARSIKKKLKDWRIKKSDSAKEIRLLAARFRHHQQQGENVCFKRMGQSYPMHKVYSHIDKHDPEPSNLPLPGYFEVISLDSNTNQTIADMEPTSSSAPLDRIAAFHSGHVPEEITIRFNRKRKLSLQHQNTRAKKAKAADIASHLTTDVLQVPYFSDTEDSGSEREVRDGTPLSKHRDTLDERCDFGPLHWAAHYNQTSTIQMLMEKNVDINARAGPNWTPLHVAAMTGNIEALRQLLLHPEIDVNATDAIGRTPLTFAISPPGPRCAHMSSEPSLTCALELITNQADVDLGGYHNKTLLHLACQEEGLRELVQIIAAKTRWLDERDSRGYTPLAYAFCSENEDYVSELMAAGANLNIPAKDGRTPGHIACFHASSELLLKIVESDVDLTVRGSDDETILHLACQRNMVEVVKAIIKKFEVDVNARSVLGVTPLIIAASAGHFEIVRILVEAGCNTDCVDKSGDTAFTAAIRTGNDSLIEYLVDHSPLEPMDRTRSCEKPINENVIRNQHTLLPSDSREDPMQRPHTDLELSRVNTASSSQYLSVDSYEMTSQSHDERIASQPYDQFTTISSVRQPTTTSNSITPQMGHAPQMATYLPERSSGSINTEEPASSAAELENQPEPSYFNFIEPEWHNFANEDMNYKFFG